MPQVEDTLFFFFLRFLSLASYLFSISLFSVAQSVVFFFFRITFVRNRAGSFLTLSGTSFLTFIVSI